MIETSDDNEVEIDPTDDDMDSSIRRHVAKMGGWGGAEKAEPGELDPAGFDTPWAWVPVDDPEGVPDWMATRTRYVVTHVTTGSDEGEGSGEG